MSPSKRAFDLFFALLIGALLAGPIVVVALAVLVFDGRPIFFVSERMKSPKQAFGLIKFRTMRCVDHDSGVSGHDKSSRITGIGRVLRSTRLDELPQILNILKGDMSFVGPRPPLRQYVEKFPALYQSVLESKPGVTGLATLIFHRTEARFLANCTSAEQTDEIYSRRCVPRKARLDLIYAQNRTLGWDLWISLATLVRALPVRLR